MQAEAGASEPSHWFLAFYEKTSVPWLNRIPFIRFRHVSAFGYLAGHKAWVFYDATWQGVSIFAVSHETAKAEIGRLTAGAEVVRVASRRGPPMPIWTRFAFYCVPAMKHLLGLRCVSLTPDQFYRSVLKQGGELVLGLQTPAAPVRPDAVPGTATGADRPRDRHAGADPGGHGEPDGALRNAPGAGG